MRLRTISAEWKAKVGLPNYSNVEAGVYMLADLEEGEDAAHAQDVLLLWCKEAVKTQLRSALAERKPAAPPPAKEGPNEPPPRQPGKMTKRQVKELDAELDALLGGGAEPDNSAYEARDARDDFGG